MDPRLRLLRALDALPNPLADRHAFVGFDGFVDTVVSPVARRDGPGEAFTPFGGIAEFGQQVLAAAGKSANFEFHPRQEKMGGNGPILAGALLALGARLTCIGPFGRPAPHPAFGALARQAELVSLGEPARTTAVEFPDGKLMLGIMRGFDDITPAALEAALPGGRYRAAVDAADLVVLGNWTMLPHMTAIYADFTERLLPGLPPRPDRIFFFDLADPEKRSLADLRAALGALARFAPFGRVTLGLNLKEAQQVLRAVDLGEEPETPAGLRAAAGKIRGRLGVALVAIHRAVGGACASADGSWWRPGRPTATPRISTGAGDHFNAGFAAGQLLGLDAEACLTLGLEAGAYYVRMAGSPNRSELAAFIRKSDAAADLKP